MLKSHFKVTEDKTLKKEITRLEWGKGFNTSFIRSAQLTVEAVGEHNSYSFLMGISGAAFRFHFHPDRRKKRSNLIEKELQTFVY
jgi:hypothetical protein